MGTGQKQWVELFENRLNTVPMMLPFTKDGKHYKQPLYPMLEEIKLYRYVFPKEELDAVIKTLGFDKGSKFTGYPQFANRSSVLRKILKAKPIPKLNNENETGFMLHKEHVGLLPIGIKEDKEMDFPDGSRHEAI